jgi:hypothetical protein
MDQIAEELIRLSTFADLNSACNETITRGVSYSRSSYRSRKWRLLRLKR